MMHGMLILLHKFLKGFSFLLYLLLLQNNRVDEDNGVCYDSTKRKEVFPVLPVFGGTFVQPSTLYYNIDSPESVISHIVHDTTKVGKDRKYFESYGFVGF